MAPRGKHGRPAVENTDYAKFAERIIRALASRAASDVDALPQLRHLEHVIEAETRRAVQACRAEGYSWADVGDRLGVSRQSAHERYGEHRTPDRAQQLPGQQPLY